MSVLLVGDVGDIMLMLLVLLVIYGKGAKVAIRQRMFLLNALQWWCWWVLLLQIHNSSTFFSTTILRFTSDLIAPFPLLTFRIKVFITVCATSGLILRTNK